MKFLILSISFLLSSLVSSFGYSATRLQFFIGDRNSMAVLTPTDVYGNSDSDSADLYQIMNVPEQDTMLGKGKSIVSVNRDFNLVCGEYRNQCQVILSKSADTLISGSNKHMRFAVSGTAALGLAEQFKLNSKGEAYFRTTDKYFLITGNANTFLFEAHSN